MVALTADPEEIPYNPAGYVDTAIAGAHAFFRSAWGILVAPYQTMRRIIVRSRIEEAGWVFIFVVLYFALVSIVRISAFHPFTLTRHFLALFTSAIFLWALISLSLYGVARILGGEGDWRALATGWAYTLIPTLLWFLMTSILSFILPPPRTASLPGTVFSLLFLGASAVLFYWKFTLAYLVVRFAMRLDLGRIIVVFSVAVPAAFLYGMLFNRLGVFRVPFI